MDGEYENQLIRWAHKYNAFERLARGPEHLFALVEPLNRAFQRDLSIPEWAGVDLLRGWAFYLVRAHRHGGAYEPIGVEYPEFMAIVEVIGQHPAAKKSDLPPPPPSQPR